MFTGKIAGKWFFVLFVVLCVPFLSFGQQSDTTEVSANSNNRLRGRVVVMEKTASGVFTEVDLTGANILLFLPSDTLAKVSVQGIFSFDNIPVGKARLRVSFLGYADRDVEFVIKPGDNTLTVMLDETSEEIESVRISARVLIMTARGDTLVYNPKAVKQLEGDDAIDLFRNLPGVRIEGEKLSINGQQVARAYVNGMLVFGENPMDMLRNLPAHEVEEIEVYEEYANRRKDARRMRGEKKEHVVNVKTKSNILKMLSSDIEVGAGTEFVNPEQLRYLGKGRLELYYPKWIAKVNGKASNTGVTDAYRTDADAVFSLERNWTTQNNERGQVAIKGDVSYERTRRENFVESDYYATDQYTRRYESNTEEMNRRVNTQSIDGNVNIPGVANGTLTFKHSSSWSCTDDQTLKSRLSEVNDDPAEEERRKMDQNDHQFHLTEQAGWFSRPDRFLTFSLLARADIARGDGLEWRRDSISVSPVWETVKIDSDVPEQEYYLNSSLGLNINRTLTSIRFNYIFRRTDIQRERNAFDYTDPDNAVVDYLNTYDFTDRNSSHRIGSNLMFRFDNNVRMGFGLSYENARVDQDERIPVERSSNNRFEALLPSFSIGFGSFSIGNFFMFTYSSSQILPSVEQLRSWIDDSNPWLLTAGNPDLRQSINHSAEVDYKTMIWSNRSSLGFTLSSHYTTHPIVSRISYYTENTLLPEWNYEIPAYSSLITYANAERSFNTELRAFYEAPLPSIGFLLKSEASFTYDLYPEWIGNQLIDTREINPYCDLHFVSNFSDRIRFGIRSVTSYTNSGNDLGDFSYISERVGVDWDIRDLVFRGFYLDGDYSLRFTRCYSGSLPPNPVRHLLNMGCGVKLNKGNVDIGIRVYDLFNDSSGYAFSAYSDRMTRSWSLSMGRYFLFRIAFKMRNK